ncbi:hypothetical protein [Halovenus amylolytica]|uniref:phage NrS-1 polymerase family protein n=1 Tax=Halovenus amylolytica TaxID=2500550 RepID=UPI003615F868
MPSETPEIGTSVLGDTELVEKAGNAANGRKFKLLFEEGWESTVIKRVYDTPRRARLALVNHLVWWTRHDIAQVRRLFKQSALCTDELIQYREYYTELVQSALSLLGDECYNPNHS